LGQGKGGGGPLSSQIAPSREDRPGRGKKGEEARGMIVTARNWKPVKRQGKRGEKKKKKKKKKGHQGILDLKPSIVTSHGNWLKGKKQRKERRTLIAHFLETRRNVRNALNEGAREKGKEKKEGGGGGKKKKPGE